MVDMQTEVKSLVSIRQLNKVDSSHNFTSTLSDNRFLLIVNPWRSYDRLFCLFNLNFTFSYSFQFFLHKVVNFTIFLKFFWILHILLSILWIMYHVLSRSCMIYDFGPSWMWISLIFLSSHGGRLTNIFTTNFIFVSLRGIRKFFFVSTFEVL